MRFVEPIAGIVREVTAKRVRIEVAWRRLMSVVMAKCFAAWAADGTPNAAPATITHQACRVQKFTVRTIADVNRSSRGRSLKS